MRLNSHYTSAGNDGDCIYQAHDKNLMEGKLILLELLSVVPPTVIYPCLILGDVSRLSWRRTFLTSKRPICNPNPLFQIPHNPYSHYALGPVTCDGRTFRMIPPTSTCSNSSDFRCPIKFSH